MTAAQTKIPAHIVLNAIMATTFGVQFRRTAAVRGTVIGQPDGTLWASIVIDRAVVRLEGVWSAVEHDGEYGFRLRAYGATAAHWYAINDELRLGARSIQLASHGDNLELTREDRTDDDHEGWARWARGAADLDAEFSGSEVP